MTHACVICSLRKANRFEGNLHCVLHGSRFRTKVTPERSFTYGCYKTCFITPVFCVAKEPVGSGLNGTSTGQERRINHEQRIKQQRTQTKEEERTQAFESLMYHATSAISKGRTEPSSDLYTCCLYQLYLMLRLFMLVFGTAILAASCSELQARLC
jgi:hypothetical protein